MAWGGYFYLLVLFGSDFVNWIFIKNFQFLGRWKLTSIGLIWHPAKLIKITHRWRQRWAFFFFHSSCQWGLRKGTSQLSTSGPFWICIFTSVKGQLISKGLFGFFNSPKKRTKNFCPSRLGQKLTFSSSFFGRIEDTKSSFRD